MRTIGILLTVMMFIAFPLVADVPEWSGIKTSTIVGQLDIQGYDVVSDGYGNHIVWIDNTNVMHALVGNDGVNIRSPQVIQANASSPSIVSYQSKERIVLFDGNTTKIKIFESTNGGETWSALDPPGWTSSNARFIDGVWDQRGMHFVWESDGLVYYSRRKNDGTFEAPFNVSNGEASNHPSVAVSADRAHVAWHDGLGAGTPKTRDYNFSTPSWEGILTALNPSSDEVTQALTILVYGNELHLFTQTSTSVLTTWLNDQKKTISSSQWSQTPDRLSDAQAGWKPSSLVEGGLLYAAVQSIGELKYKTYDGTTWSSSITVATGGGAAAIASHRVGLNFFWVVNEPGQQRLKLRRRIKSITAANSISETTFLTDSNWVSDQPPNQRLPQIAAGTTVTAFVNSMTFIEPENWLNVYGTLNVNTGATVECRPPNAELITRPGGTVNNNGTIKCPGLGSCIAVRGDATGLGRLILGAGNSHSFSGGGFLAMQGGEYVLKSNSILSIGNGSRIAMQNPSTFTFETGSKIILEGTIDCADNVSMELPSTSYLDAKPGARFNMGSSSALTLKGKFTAIGTAANPITFTSSSATPSAGSWYIMFLYGGPNSLQYCNIKYATHALYVKNTSTTLLDNITISDCSGDGIFAFNTSKSYGALTIQNSSIQNVGTGIELNNARADLSNTIIKNNRYSGIYGYNSTLYLSNSKSQNNGYYGLHVSGSTSSGTLSDRYLNPGYNVIYNNNAAHFANVDEVLSMSSAYLYIGERTCVVQAEVPGSNFTSSTSQQIPCTYIDYAGYNNIYHGSNLSSGQKLIDNQTTYCILAHLTHWGNCQPSSSDFNGCVDYSYSLCSPTSSPSSTIVAIGYDNAGTSSVAFAESQNSKIAIGEAISSAQSATDTSDLEKLKKFFLLKKRQLDADPDSALPELHMLACLAGPGGMLSSELPEGWENYLNQLKARAETEKGRNLLDAFLLQAQIDRRNYENVIILADDLLSRNPEDDVWMHAQSSKLTAYLGKKDLANAEMIMNQIKNSGRQVDPMAISSLENVINVEKSAISASQLDKRVIAIKSPEKTQASQEPVILNNYPNPFNPTTTIEYKLPRREYVRLIIYDVLGREVKRLVDELQELGVYRVRFDASNLSSGVYFYKLTAGQFYGVKKFIVVK